MMKVLQIMASEGEGGLEKHLVELSNGLAERGVEVSVLASERYRSRLHPSVRLLPFAFQGSRRNPLMLYRLARLIRRENADIIHAQANKAGNIIATLKPFANGRLVGTVHNIKRNLKFTRHLDAVIGVSKAVSGQISHPSRQTIYNGILPRHHTTSDDATQPVINGKTNGPIWLAVGRLVPAKGFDTLLHAFQHVQGYLLIAGSGPEQSTLEALQDQLQLRTRVQFLGHREDVPALMCMADAVVISSRREGFSYVFSEALFSSKPVVSTDVPIPNEVLDQSLIAPVDDPEALARIMSTLDPSDPVHQEAQQFAHRELTLDAMVENTMKLYRSVLGTAN